MKLVSPKPLPVTIIVRAVLQKRDIRDHGIADDQSPGAGRHFDNARLIDGHGQGLFRHSGADYETGPPRRDMRREQTRRDDA